MNVILMHKKEHIKYNKEAGESEKCIGKINFIT